MHFCTITLNPIYWVDSTFHCTGRRHLAAAVCWLLLVMAWCTSVWDDDLDGKWSFLLNIAKEKVAASFFGCFVRDFTFQIVYGLTNAISILFIERDLYLYYHCQCSAIFVWATLRYQWPLRGRPWNDLVSS